MNRPLKVMHVASFSGNIGDEANHQGFRRKFMENVCSNVLFHDVEIRCFYRSWNLRKFDSSFAQEANQFDLVIFGGGNFFEACWDYSATATTIDLSHETLAEIRPPIFFNGIGFDDGKGISEINIKKFGAFLSYLLEHPEKYMVSVRNDGSFSMLQKYYARDFLQGIYRIPDGGFFFQPNRTSHPENPRGKSIGVCLACDMPEIRYGGEMDAFSERMARFLNDVMATSDYSVVFYPHIYSDLAIISHVLERIRDSYRRSRTTVAPLLNANTQGAEMIFDSYRHCDMILGMRFHSNVCAIGNGIPTLGLISYPKHGMLYEELGISGRMYHINHPDFVNNLMEGFEDSVGRLDAIRRQYVEIVGELNRELDSFHAVLRRWMER